MIIAGIYSFNHGAEFIASNYPAELEEVKQIIAAVDSTNCKTKTSREKTRLGKALYSPRALNKAFAKDSKNVAGKSTKWNASIQPDSMYLDSLHKIH